MSSLLAFVALPGVVAYLVPVLMASVIPGLLVFWFGLVPLALGSGALAWCAIEFHRCGRGTLAPWNPPIALVTSGLFAASRNPMYLAVALVLAGWAIVFRSPWHLVYAMAVTLAFHVRVVWGEEPRLGEVFGTAWLDYRSTVPRWLPPLRRWPGWLWFAAGALLGSAFWAFSPFMLGHAEPWDSSLPVWSLSWPAIGAIGAAARHARGLLLPLGFAFGQAAATFPGVLLSKFGLLGWTFIGGGLLVALASTLALLVAAALWRRGVRAVKGDA